MNPRSTRGVRGPALGLALAMLVLDGGNRALDAATGTASQNATARSVGLKVVVIAGEDAINVIQQRTAVAPIIEVRDRNDLPVPGALVTFTINGGKVATFASGGPTLTVTTSATGRAVASTLTPIGRGAVQIQVSAAFQGQTVAATIAQTNVMTVAEAAAAGASGGGTGSGGAAVGGGGGLSGTTLGIIGGVVGAGALAATQAGGGGSSNSSSSATTTYTGPFDGQSTSTQTSADDVVNCVWAFALSGTMRMTLEQKKDGMVTGTALLNGTSTFTGVEFNRQSCLPVGNLTISPVIPVAGTTANFGGQVTFAADGGGTSGNAFSGALSGGVITGTVTMTSSGRTTIPDPDGRLGFVRSSATFPVTLR